MSHTFKLSLPTDIPWRRICVSEDMLDPVPCDAEYPPRWRSSLAVFRYDPAEEYQPLEDMVTSYLKVVVTVAPFAPEISPDRARKYVPPVLIDDLEEAFPCYGALLHVLVSPRKADLNQFPLDRYPFFIDFEPKKRELYESVTDTGEVLSGSSTSLTVGKNAATTDTTENYNLDTGWNFGLNASYAGTGGGVTVGGTGQVGVVNKSGLQRTDIRTTDESTERRERQSHTTQLSQMYNLFQAFHLGTNRALFFLEPRPHIRQSEATFINGPRALEGIQEIFLVVVRPKAMEHFCVSALLETAHLTKEPVFEHETATHLIPFRLYGQAQNRDTTSGETDWTETVTHTETFAPPAGWEIDLTRGRGGYDYTILRENRRRRGPQFSVTANSISVYGEVTWRFWETGLFNDDHYEDGYLDVDVTVYLRKKEPKLKEYVRKLFLSARDLCCCPDPPKVVKPWISYVADLSRFVNVAIYHGLANAKTFAESRTLASAIRREMVESGSSSRRVRRGGNTYQDSDVFVSRAAALIRAHRLSADLERPIEAVGALDPKDRERLHGALGSERVGDALTIDAALLSLKLGISKDEAVALKQRVLAAIAARPSRPGRPGGGGPGEGDPSGPRESDIESRIRALRDLLEKGLILAEDCEASIRELLKRFTR